MRSAGALHSGGLIALLDTAAAHVAFAFNHFCCFNKMLAIKMTKVLNYSRLDEAVL
jgi:hypothetical protein